jgi:hypothetical protein
VIVARGLERDDDDLCRGARRGIAQALDDARLALAALSATGDVSGAGSGLPGSPFPIGSFAGLPGGGGGSQYRPGT